MLKQSNPDERKFYKSKKFLMAVCCCHLNKNIQLSLK